MNFLKVAIIIFILGFAIVMFAGNTWGDSTTTIIISILYLCAIVGGSTSMILDELRSKK